MPCAPVPDQLGGPLQLLLHFVNVFLVLESTKTGQSMPNLVSQMLGMRGFDICKTTESVPHPVTQILNKDVELDWLWC